MTKYDERFRALIILVWSLKALYRAYIKIRVRFLEIQGLFVGAH